MGLKKKERAELSDKIALACRILGKLDMTHAALGHVSYRIPGSDSMLIKGKGPEEVGVRYTTAEDIIEVDFKAEKVQGKEGLQPPSESFLHFWFYKLNPELQCVIHVHPKPAVILTATNKEIRPIYCAYGAGARLAVEGIPVYQRSITIHDDDLGESFATFVGTKKVALMRGHGVTVVGSGIEDATVRAIQLNELITMNYLAYQIGDPEPVLEEDLEEMRRPMPAARARGSAGGVAGNLAVWRYYCTLTGESKGS